ncbi:MAG: hypothetical protein ACYTEQ_27965, partial [Planctomycetota bacterium]
MTKKKIKKPTKPNKWLDDWADTVSGGTAFIVGNGPSKKPEDVDALAPYGAVIACNTAFRFHHADYLVFMDSL